jgi:hypothetical protein
MREKLFILNRRESGTDTSTSNIELKHHQTLRNFPGERDCKDSNAFASIIEENGKNDPAGKK